MPKPQKIYIKIIKNKNPPVQILQLNTLEYKVLNEMHLTIWVKET